MSNRGLTNRKAISNSIDKELYEGFTELANESGKTQSRLLDEAIFLLLQAYGKKLNDELKAKFRNLDKG
mgnify:CR=1 FL=1